MPLEGQAAGASVAAPRMAVDARSKEGVLSDRAFAFVADAVLMCVPFLAWGLIFWAVPAAAVWDGTPPNWFAPVVLLPYPLLYLAIVDVMPQVVNGSFKHECKLQVTTMDGHKICLIRSFWRTLLKLCFFATVAFLFTDLKFLAVLAALDFLSPFFTRGKRALHDYLAGAQIVRSS